MPTYYMNVATGSVDTYEDWKSDWEESRRTNCLEEMGWKEEWEDNFANDRLVQVVRNDKDSLDYNPDYGEWRPA